MNRRERIHLVRVIAVGLISLFMAPVGVPLITMLFLPSIGGSDFGSGDTGAIQDSFARFANIAYIAQLATAFFLIVAGGCFFYVLWLLTAWFIGPKSLKQEQAVSQNHVRQPETKLMSEHLIISTTTDSADEAHKIAAALIEQQLAACVQIVGPMTSVYRWKGKVETSQEWRCDAKTTAGGYERLATTITRLHSYDQPEIIATPIVNGSAGYLAWVSAEVAGRETS